MMAKINFFLNQVYGNNLKMKFNINSDCLYYVVGD